MSYHGKSEINTIFCLTYFSYCPDLKERILSTTMLQSDLIGSPATFHEGQLPSNAATAPLIQTRHYQDDDEE